MDSFLETVDIDWDSYDPKTNSYICTPKADLKLPPEMEAAIAEKEADNEALEAHSKNLPLTEDQKSRVAKWYKESLGLYEASLNDELITAIKPNKPNFDYEKYLQWKLKEKKIKPFSLIEIWSLIWKMDLLTL